MKTTKILIPLFAVMLLSGCATTHENNNFPLDSASNSHDVYAFEAATSVGLLNDALNDTNLKAKMSKKDLTPDVIDEIASYLPSIEAALTGVDSLVTSISAESDLAEYETMMTVTYQDINSIKNTFVMYYNETILNDDDHDRLVKTLLDSMNDKKRDFQNPKKARTEMGVNRFEHTLKKEEDIIEKRHSVRKELDEIRQNKSKRKTTVKQQVLRKNSKKKKNKKKAR